MRYVLNPVGTPPAGLLLYPRQSFKDDPNLSATIVRQNTDRIIQINASLAYVTSQATSGAVPILERRSLIRRHSLLGIGMPFLALSRLCRSIQEAFAKGSLEQIVGGAAATAAPLPGLDRLPEYNPDKWEQHSLNVLAEGVPPREPHPKLPYFSARLGFRETEYSVAAALQAVSLGAHPTWSLLTVTHELVHGHVRNILAVLLATSKKKPDGALETPAERWERFHAAFASQLKADDRQRVFLADSIRTVLFSYACLTLTHGSLTREAKIGTRPSEEDGAEIADRFFLVKLPKLMLILDRELRNISEVLVHVLDLHYFYSSRLSAYVPLIWRSWAALPQLNGDLQQYVLRTMLVIAAKMLGSPTDRFEQAKKRLAEWLEPHARLAAEGATVVGQAVAFVESDEVERLFYPFKASLLLVDLADRVLTSKAIRGALLGVDPNVLPRKDPVSAEQWSGYQWPPASLDDCVLAPAALVVQLLTNALERGDDDQAERMTAEMLLACCSNPRSGV